MHNKASEPLGGKAAPTKDPFDGESIRHRHTIDLIRKVATPKMRVVDVASFGALVPELRRLGLNNIMVTMLAWEGAELHGELVVPSNSDDIANERCPFDRFDIEGTFPYDDECFDIVIFTEAVEHLTRDPMHTISEINRITSGGGWLVLSTPNPTCTRSLIKGLRGQHPYVWAPYSKDKNRDRHNREYTPNEIRELLEGVGYELVEFETLDVYAGDPSMFKKCKKKLFDRLAQFLGLFLGRAVSPRDRGDTIFVLARKTGEIKVRYPSFLYYA